MKYAINSKVAYHETMLAVYKLMDKGESKLSAADLRKLRAMSVAAEKYEDEVLGLKPKKTPKSIVELIELKMFEIKLTQSDLATEIGIAQSKVSEILSGKRKPDLPFIKGVQKVLKIDAQILLDYA